MHTSVAPPSIGTVDIASCHFTELLTAPSSGDRWW